MGYWSIVSLIIAAPFTGLSIWVAMIFCDYAKLPVFLGPLIIIPEALVAYKFNKARRHWRGDAFDDRLSTQRMSDAEAWLIEEWEHDRE